MKVSKNSWHYKLSEMLTTNFHKINNGCSYIQNLIRLLFALVFLVIVAIVVFLIPGSLIAKSYDLDGFWAGGVMIGGSAVIWAAVAGIAYAIYRLKDKSAFKSEVTIVKEFIHSKKEKYCPKLEIVD